MSDALQRIKDAVAGKKETDFHKVDSQGRAREHYVSNAAVLAVDVTACCGSPGNDGLIEHLRRACADAKPDLVVSIKVYDLNHLIAYAEKTPV